LFPKGRESSLRYAKIENKFKDRYKNIRTTLYDQCRDVIKLIDLEGCRCFVAFRTSESETDAKDKE
jgi:hypothetical protein